MPNPIKALMSVAVLYAMLFALPAGQLWAQQGQLSTHILDINKGEPAQGVTIILFKYDDHSQDWLKISTNMTDSNGRVAELLPGREEHKGIYKLRFEVASYFEKLKQASIYPYIEVVFKIEGRKHYHIPLTLSGNGYSTYRGS